MMSGERIFSATGKPMRRGGGGGFGGVAGERATRQRNAVGREHAPRPRPRRARTVRRRARRRSRPGRGRGRRSSGSGRAGGALHQQRLVAAIAHAVQKPGDRRPRACRRSACRPSLNSARAGRGRMRRRARPQDVAAAPRAGGQRRERLDDRARRLVRRRSAVGQFSTSTASTPSIGEQRFERRGVARARRVADDVDRIAARPGRRQHRVEPGDVSRATAASRPPARLSASVAITPAPPPLVRIASRSPVCTPVSASVSAASNSSASVPTRSMPARRKAAS